MIVSSLILTVSAYSDENFINGDVNLDGLVNTGDAVLVLRHVAELITLNGQAALNADVNQDGNINTGDAVKILRHVAGLELIED